MIMQSRCRWEIDPATTPECLVIRDMNAGDVSVTNDAEAVVADLVRAGALPMLGDRRRRLMYYDSDNNLDELRVSLAGRFVGFAPGPQRGKR